MRPENERSWPSCPRSTGGNGKRAGSPSRATSSSAAPPASLSPSRRAPLSNASPAASSRVPAEPYRRRVVGHVEHERVPARGEQARERRLERERREPQRGDVAEQVVDGHERQAAPVGQRLGRREPDEQRADQAGALRHGDGVDVGERRVRLAPARPR